MGERKKRTYVVDEDEDEWFNKKKEELDVDKSLLIRRAMRFYRAKGMAKDKKLRAMVEEDRHENLPK